MTANRLAGETSPYLLQHAANPVHWQPWDDAALAQARDENKPILLSIGYAACHWCHVMAHESFEDPDTAALMNKWFVNIKVDREERPDLDAIYQKALALMGEHGGWPLTMFITPDGEPFWGGTYFPKEAQFGRPAFHTVLRELAKAWTDSPEKVTKNADLLREALQRPPDSGVQGLKLSADILDRAAVQLLGHMDMTDGGLQGAPKFPMPFLLEFLWRAWRRTRDTRLREAVILTLDKMCQGGIYDHLGGGFARYSTDAQWLAPHFEKMLYDNALMIELLTLVWQETRSPLYATRVAETVDWLARDMRAEGGAFAATLDADSEGEEGRFYVWTEAEIDRLLGADAALFKQAYDVRRGGNWEGKTILNRNGPQPGGGAAVEDVLARCRRTLFEARERRVRPGRDDKVLADWNGMMIAALARAALTFDRPGWLELARAAFDGVVARMARDGGRLGHSLRQGRLQQADMLDDYANMARAALMLFEATGEAAYLARARDWAGTADGHFWDSAGGGWFFTPDDAEHLITRTKSIHDAAAPSGNGLMVEVLARLFWITGEDGYRDTARAAVNALSGDAVRQFPGAVTLFNAFELLDGAVQVVIAGAPGDPAVAALRHAAATAGEPNLVLTQGAPDAPLPPGHPAAGKGPVEGKAAAYICRGPTCGLPVTAPEALRVALSAVYPTSPS